jgi:hypothetical protein
MITSILLINKIYYLHWINTSQYLNYKFLLYKNHEQNI